MKWLFLFALSLAAGCNSSEPETRDDTVGKEIADDYQRTLDKARNVDLQMQDRVNSLEQSMQDGAPETQDP